jgi:hypothetical protein
MIQDDKYDGIVMFDARRRLASSSRIGTLEGFDDRSRYMP